MTIENWILNVEKPKKLANWFLSGYYGFDSQWIWNNNKWNYRFTLYDTKLNIPVANEIFSAESKKNVQDFIWKNTLNQNKNCITTDLDETYKSPI